MGAAHRVGRDHGEVKWRWPANCRRVPRRWCCEGSTAVLISRDLVAACTARGKPHSFAALWTMKEGMRVKCRRAFAAEFCNGANASCGSPQCCDIYPMCNKSDGSEAPGMLSCECAFSLQSRMCSRY